MKEMMRPESWKGKLGRDKKGDHSLKALIFMVISVILGVITHSFKFNHTLWSIFSQDLAKITFFPTKQVWVNENEHFHTGAEKVVGNREG